MVTGHFDPLTAEHAAMLKAARGSADRLVVIVTSPERPLLEARARAELVASLSVVDEVIIAASVHEEEANDAERTRALAARVRSRH